MDVYFGNYSLTIRLDKVHKKVKLSRYRPGGALGVP